MSSYDGIRDEILLNFQAITGINKHEEALEYLESCDWNLEEAVNKVIPETVNEGSSSFMNDHGSPSSLYSQAFSAFSEVRRVDKDSPEEKPYNVDITGTSKMTPFNSKMSGTENSFSSIPSTSSQHDKVLDINIKIKYEGDDSEKCPFPFEIPQSTTVEELKTLLHHLLGIPPCHQVLDGFAKEVHPSTVITRDLLPGNLSLTLTTSPEVSGFMRRKSEMEEEENYEVQVLVEEHNKTYDLRFPPSKIVKDIKSDLHDLSGIPVRHQLWTGWPTQTTDVSTLRSLGLPKVNKFVLRQQIQERTPKMHHKVLKITEDASEDNSSADEFEDASELLPEEDYLVMDDDVPTSQSSKSLIPPDIEGEENAAKHFVHEFQNRYGNYTPLFFQGTLGAALKESVMLPARTRKPLAIYIHHDKSVSANVFCSQSLCQQSVVDYLSTNFVIWGWDITHESNKNTLLKIISTNLGHLASNTVRGYSVDKLPAVLFINRSRGSSEILTVIHGNAILDEVMQSLLHASEIFEEQRGAEVMEEDLREQRETVKAEQDAAYHASLEADRAKEQARKLAQYEEKVERERQQSIKEHEDAVKEAVRASLESGLPPEPAGDCDEPLTVLRFRVPKGDIFKRTFTQNTKLQVVLDYLYVQGYAPNEYKYLQSWPRRCITNLDTSKTLADHRFPLQELITLEERPDGTSD